MKEYRLMTQNRKYGFRLSILLGILFLIFSYTNCSEGFKNKISTAKSSIASSREESPVNINTQIPTTQNTTPQVTTAPSFKCRPPRKYVYTILPGQERTFACSPSVTDIFNINIPDTGFAIGRASLVFRNNNTDQIYFWSASVVVGTGDISYAQGDDICPNTSTPVKRVLGYGHLNSDNNSNIRVLATQGSSPCTDNQVSVFSGGTLDVWVEDADVRCQKKDINMVSSYQTLGLSKHYWSTEMQEIISLHIPATNDRSTMLVLSAIEGSPEKNPNSVCGQESATLVSQAVTNLQGVVDTQIEAIPASQGMGHVVLSPQALVSYSSSLNEISLFVGSNTSEPVFTNDCCGDGKIGFVKLP